MYFYHFDEFKTDIDRFVTQMGDYRPDIILAIARGGVTFGHFLSEKLNLRELYTLNSIHYDDTIKREDIRLFNIPEIAPDKDVLIVDDIVDSGDTMLEVRTRLSQCYPSCRLKTGALFYKKEAKFQPDYKLNATNEWIHFFWNYT